MAVRDEMELKVGEPPTMSASASAPASAGAGSFRLLQLLILGLTVAGVIVGLRISVPGGMAPVNRVAFGLTIVWALVGFVDTHARTAPARRCPRSISWRRRTPSSR